MADQADEIERRVAAAAPCAAGARRGPPPHRLDWWVLDVSKSSTRRDLLARPGSPLLASPPYTLWLVDQDVLVAGDDVAPPLKIGTANCT